MKLKTTSTKGIHSSSQSGVDEIVGKSFSLPREKARLREKKILRHNQDLPMLQPDVLTLREKVAAPVLKDKFNLSSAFKRVPKKSLDIIEFPIEQRFN